MKMLTLVHLSHRVARILGRAGRACPLPGRLAIVFRARVGILSQPQPCLANRMPLNKENIFLIEAFIGTRMSFTNKKCLF